MSEYFVVYPDDAYLMHSGRSKKDGAHIGSGRYPLGSGDRPYQRMPAAARKRQMARAEKANKKQKVNNKQDNNNKGNKKKSNNTDEVIKSVANSSKEAVNAAKRIEKRTRPKSQPLDLSSMSDEELRRRINRRRLERDYNDLYNNDADNISKGRAHVIDVLDTIGDVVAIATPLAILTAEIIKLKKG